MNNLYSLVETADGSSTVRSTIFQEAMHSDAGAYEESIVKHVHACGKLGIVSDSLDVLDVGFGIGYNICALMNEWAALETKPILNIVSLELDSSVSEFLYSLRFNDGRDTWFDIVKDAFRNGSVSGDGYRIRIMFGDARKSIRQLNDDGMNFDAVFQDAFSPGKNPELWTLDYFLILRKLIRDDGVLTTYSAAPQIRRALMEAGFKIAKSRSTGKKKEGTIASPHAQLDYLDTAAVREILSLGKSTVYRDETLDTDRDNILNRRIMEMARIREDHRSSL